MDGKLGEKSRMEEEIGQKGVKIEIVSLRNPILWDYF